jgi:hypothetical protein
MQDAEYEVPCHIGSEDLLSLAPGLSDTALIFTLYRSTIERAASDKYHRSSRHDYEIVTVTASDLNATSPSYSRKASYQFIVTRSDAFASKWGWEICRDGRPLPARLRNAGFWSARTASAAAEAALRDFLTALAREETKPD